MSMPGSPTGLHRSPVRIRGGGAYALPRGGRTPAHRHDCWELVCYRTGRARITVDGEPAELGPGALWLTPPGRSHSEDALTAFSNWFVLIDAPAGTPWPLFALDDAAGAVARICAAVTAESSTDAPDREALLACLAGELDLRLRRAARTRRDRTSALVAEAMALLELEPAAPLRVGRLAARLGVATSTLRAAFHACHGASPAVVAARLRAGRATALLAGTGLTLEQVAGMCGYHSASHLSRWIRRLHGRPPGALRGGAGATGSPRGPG